MPRVSPRNRIEAVHNVLEEDNHANDKAVEADFDTYDVKPDAGSNMADEEDDDVVQDGSLQFTGPTNDRQRAVVKSFQFAWEKYREFAWGKDHLRPITKSGHNWFGLGLTMVDALDTMYIMNLKDEFKEARDWVESKLHFDHSDVNLFETTIRVLGGLLSSFHLTADNMFLNKAKDLADKLMGAFDTPSGIPFSDVYLQEGR